MVKRQQPPQFQKKNRQVRQVKQPSRPPKRTMDAWDILEWQGQEAWNMV